MPSWDSTRFLPQNALWTQTQDLGSTADPSTIVVRNVTAVAIPNGDLSPR